MMKTFLATFLVGACTAASAQTPAANPMPDGSRDMYAGLGVVSSAQYLGARERKVRALPLVQVAWSNGVFISGMSAGMHLSTNKRIEYGPLLSLHAGRDHHGSGDGAGGVEEVFSGILPAEPLEPVDPVDGKTGTRMAGAGKGLAGMGRIATALQAGGFANFYLSPRLRVVSSVQYGAGHGRDGLIAHLGLQHVARELGARHGFSMTAGANFVNRNYNQTYFGINDAEAFLGVREPYEAGGGLRDVHVHASWNWALSPSWVLASTARVAQLKGDARRSPLVQRSTQVTVSTGLAYRF